MMKMNSTTDNPVTIWQIDTINDPSKLTVYFDLLSAEEATRAKKMRVESSRNSYITSHAVMRLILKKYLRLPEPESKINIQLQNHGKPYINHTQPVYFNLSHTKDIALFGISTKNSVGIDIEYIKPGRDIVNIAKRFFHPDEFKWLTQVDTQKQVNNFYQLWCYKEACLKGIGSGLQGDLSSFAISPNELQTGGNIMIQNSNWHFQPITTFDNYKAAVSHEHNSFQQKLIQWQHNL